MRLLVLGGSRFLGRSIVESALAADWDVSVFNRGITATNIDGAHVVNGDRASMDDLVRLASHGPWDAVIDSSGYGEQDVDLAARVLQDVSGWYIFMSTVSVYADWPKRPLTEDSPLILESPGEQVPDDGPTEYGYQKTRCEAAVRSAFGDRSTVLRPGVVLGPHEYVGRLPWWLRRVQRGGQVVAPGEPGRSIQPIDVRDLADFSLLCAQQGKSGAFNVTAPVGRETFGGMLEACADATGSHPEYVWVPDDRLLALGIRQWSELPMWRTFPGVWRVESSRASLAGLKSRPLAETVRDTWSWLRAQGNLVVDERSLEIGLTSDREDLVLSEVLN